MNRKVIFRCSLISLLLAVIAPLLIMLINTLFGVDVIDLLAGSLLLAYVATVVAVFLLLLGATLVLHQLSSKPAGSVEIDDDDREIGEVKWFNVSKGYGFIVRDEGEDVFVHFRAIRGKGHRTLAEGQKVRYYVVRNERGLQADDVTVIT